MWFLTANAWISKEAQGEVAMKAAVEITWQEKNCQKSVHPMVCFFFQLEITSIFVNVPVETKSYQNQIQFLKLEFWSSIGMLLQLLVFKRYRCCCSASLVPETICRQKESSNWYTPNDGLGTIDHRYSNLLWLMIDRVFSRDHPTRKPQSFFCWWNKTTRRWSPPAKLWRKRLKRRSFCSKWALSSSTKWVQQVQS